MIIWLWISVILLFSVNLGLWSKILLMRKSAGEIEKEFEKRIVTDTNTLIQISSRDSALRQLAASINRQLRQFRRQRHRYHQGDLELKEAVANISHDLRTPLTAIFGYLDLLKQEKHTDKGFRYLAQIENRADALKQLTEELFRYSILSSAEELNIEKVDLCKILEESLLSFYGSMQQKGMTPDIFLPDQPVYRFLDAGAVYRIFDNIINNALKYSEGDLRVTLEETGRITFSNGAKGLDSVAVGKLFDRFYTVENGRSSSGLGLSIAKLLTDRMKGSIQADYRNGRLSILLFFPEDEESVS